MSIVKTHVATALFISFAFFATGINTVAQEPTFADVPYISGGGERQQLDIYLPKNYQEVEKLPVLVWVHGGSWQRGSKKDMPGKNYVELGYACVSINYRLSQHAVFPAQIEDCKAAIRWLRANAKKYHLDPDRIGVWGASAGGHLVALLGTSHHKKEFDVGDHLDQSSEVQAVCAIFGVMDFTPFAALPADLQRGGSVVNLFGGSVAEKRELAGLASPIFHITKDCPPFLLLHGTEDRLVPVSQSTRFYDALKKAGVEAEIVIQEGAGHDSSVFSPPETQKKVIDFFDKNVKRLL